MTRINKYKQEEKSNVKIHKAYIKQSRVNQKSKFPKILRSKQRPLRRGGKKVRTVRILVRLKVK